MRRFLSFIAVAVMLSACSGLATHTEVEKLDQAKPVGSAFTKRLTLHYKAYSKDRAKWLDYADAKHFAKKGLMAAEGKVVMPEPLSNWHLDDKSASTLRTARIDLLQLLNAGGRAQAPFEAADAQFYFDCWIEQQEQSWVSNNPVVCKGQFDKAYSDLKARIQKSLPPSIKAGESVPVVEKKKETNPKAVEATMDEGMFLVFFDFDRSLLNDSGKKVIDQIAEQAKKRKDLKSITIIGHADTSGPDKYNQRLSERRAEAVKAALVLKGVSADLIKTEGRGEKEPMVATPNNTREPANRRAEIKFE